MADDDLIAAIQQEAAQSPEKADVLRSLIYKRLSDNPSHPSAGKLRTVLSALPRVKVGQGFDQPGLPKETVRGELSGGDLGSELPPTPDETVAMGPQNGSGGPQSKQVSRALESRPQEMPLPQKVALVAGSGPYRREFERGMDDMLTFGAGQKVAGVAGRLLGDKPDVDLGVTGKTDPNSAPNARGYGQLAGALTGKGLTGLVGRTTLGVTAPIANAGRGIVGNTILGAIRGGLTNELAMPVISGGQTLVGGPQNGEDVKTAAGLRSYGGRIIDAMKNEALNPFNAAAGMLMGIPAGASRGIRETGQTGRDLRLIEQYGAKPSRIGRGPQGGIFESPAMRDIEGSSGDQGAASRRAAEGVLNSFDEEGASLNRQYGADKTSARDQGFLEGRISTDAVREDAQKLISGMGLTSSERSAIQREVLDELDKHPGGMTVDDFNDFRGKLGRIFGVGPGETSVPAVDTLRRSAKRAVDDTEMGPINERYSKGREALTRKHEQLGLSEGARRDVNERRLANLIQRRANDEAPGTGIQEAGDLGTEQFLKENPKFSPAMDTARLLAAKERLTAGIEPHGGFFRRVGKHGLLEKNLEPALAAMYRLGAPADQLAIPAALAARYYLGGQR